MHSSSWFLVAVAALATTGVQAHNAAFAAFAASTSQCTSVSTCYEGGAESTPCTVSSGGCPPCVTFADDGCYVKVDDTCPFGVDCTSMWSGSSTSTSSGSTTSTSTSSTTGTSSSTTGASTTGTSSTSSTTAGTSSNTSSGTSSTVGVSSSSSTTGSTTAGSSSTTAGDSSGGGSDMSVVFAIIGAAIGVIAVAVIFLTLVRRSKAAHEDDDDDIANTPPAFSKNVQAPHSTTNGAMYSSYNGTNRGPGMGSGGVGEIGLDTSKGVSMNAVSYYNQQPTHNSAAPSPRVAGRAIPSQPVGMNQSTGMARPYGNSQNFGASGVNQLGASGVGVTSHAPPTPVQHLPMGGVAPSPHVRRESYEF